MRWVAPRTSAPLPEMARPDADFAYPYDRTFFVENYKAVIRAMSRWPEIPYLIIWGFLRDSHGGVEAALEVANYARDHGVGILAGVGTSGYGGVYYEGQHDYSASYQMARRPDLVVRNQQHLPNRVTNRGDTLNPVHPDVIAWMQEGIAWLFDTFPIAGVNLEIGDLFVGSDPLSTQARSTITDVQDEFYKALAAHYRLLLPDLVARYPDRLISFATYNDCSRANLEANSAFLDYLPPQALCQWTISCSQEDEVVHLPPSSRLHTGYAHLFCEANGTHDKLLPAALAKSCRIARRRGLNGVVIYGECSANSYPGKENYDAFRRYLRDPEAALAMMEQEEVLLHLPT